MPNADVEDVAFGIGQGRPSRPVLVKFSDLGGTESDRALDFGWEVSRDKVKVHPILALARFGHSQEHQRGKGAVVRGWDQCEELVGAVVLAQPALALQLLCQHQHDDCDGPAEPAEEPTEPAEEPGEGEFGFDDAEADADPTAEEADADLTAADPADADLTAVEPMPDPPVDGAHRSLQILPPPFGAERARPRAVVYVHLSAEALTAGTGVARVENVGPVLLGRLRLLLGNHCSINLKPVIDLPAGHTPIDAYEIPASLRKQLQLRYPADVFPYAAAVSRSIDMDHTIPYLHPDRGGPPGQTRLGNLGPHARRHHNQKTHGRWQVRQPEPGTWLWRSPHGKIYLVNTSGTHPLGNTEFAQATWRAAAGSLESWLADAAIRPAPRALTSTSAQSDS